MVDIQVLGSYLAESKFTTTGAGECINIDNMFIQDSMEATAYKNYVNTFVACNNKLLTVQIRGNPHIEIGNMILVVSNRYKLRFTGLVIESKLEYNGGLKGTITLLNQAALGGNV